MRRWVCAVLLGASVVAAPAAQAPVRLAQPFTLQRGEHRRVEPAGVEVTLRSASTDSGCLAPQDCSLMLFKGTLVLRHGDDTELQEVDATISPDSPLDLDFAGFRVRLDAVRRDAKGRLGATFRVLAAPVAEKPPVEIAD